MTNSDSEEETAVANQSYLQGHVNSALKHLETEGEIRQWSEEWEKMEESGIQQRLADTRDTDAFIKQELSKMHDFDTMCKFAKDNKITGNEFVR